MREELTVIELAELAKQHLEVLAKATAWDEALEVFDEVSAALLEETDTGYCNPQAAAVYRDIMNTMFLAVLSPSGAWPPVQPITQAQRNKLGELRKLIDERLEDWMPLSEALVQERLSRE